MTCYAIDGLIPVVHPSSYVHPTAVLIGDVIIGPDCYIGPLASLRGDFGRIRIEAGANVQDSCVVHGFPDSETVVETRGHIGHGAVLHGCIIRHDALVGMNAVVMDEAEVGAYSIVAACAFVRAGLKLPEKSLIGGLPAKVMRALSEEEIAWKLTGTQAYQDLTLRCHASMVEVQPLREVEADRPVLQVQGPATLQSQRRGS
ncbi:phenylacetic acid degradation protein PaaY [Roseateles sp.]|uniref:phenylacetic acid degradation protein PaaY n=1 Tax=Roseateles sp. TaxID=1971397 RepID=UPI003BA50F7D